MNSLPNLRIRELDERRASGSDTTDPFQPQSVDTMVAEAVSKVMSDSTQMTELVKALIQPLHDAIKERLIQAVNDALTLTFRATVDKLDEKNSSAGAESSRER